MDESAEEEVDPVTEGIVASGPPETETWVYERSFEEGFVGIEVTVMERMGSESCRDIVQGKSCSPLPMTKPLDTATSFGNRPEIWINATLPWAKFTGFHAVWICSGTSEL